METALTREPVVVKAALLVPARARRRPGAGDGRGSPARSGRFGWRGRMRPGLRGSVLVASGLVVLALSLGIASRAAEQLRETAIVSARGSVDSIVRGYVDPIFGRQSLDLGAPHDPAVDAQLARLLGPDGMRQISVWTRDGRIMYSTDASLRGRRFDISHELAQAFAGTTGATFGTAAVSTAPGTGLPAEFIHVYSPIRGHTDGLPVGVFEVFLDAAPIDQRIADTHRDVFLISLGAGAVLLGLLWLAFAGASRRLATQNRRLNALTEELGRSEARFRSLVQNSSDVVVVVDADGVIGYVSDAVRRVLGGEHVRAGDPFLARVHPDDRVRVSSLLDGVFAVPRAERAAELRLGHADGSWRWVEAIGQNLLDDPNVGGAVLNFRDVTDRKRLEEQLQHDAFHDPLTDLANRALFADRVTHALERLTDRPLRAAVLFVDLDDFKLVNDSLGHLAGDELLTGVAGRLRGCLRDADTAARLGGDEFGILIEEADRSVAGEVARRLLESLHEPFTIGDRQLFVAASIGIAMAGDDPAAVSAEELLRNADAAMYTAKSGGKARAEFYAAAMHASALRRLELRGRLEAAIESDELVLHYQPLVDLVTGAVAGVEALVRWRQPDRRLAPPDEFVPLAEETGLIIPLGRWVLEAACRQPSSWPTNAAGEPFSVAVNVSSRQLHDPDFPAVVRAVLAETDYPPHQLVVEVTESALLGEGESTSRAIAALKALGVRIALDDFGTGYSSLSHLRRFPIDILKIDRSFVEGIDGDDRDGRILVQSIVRLAHSLRLETVAEGIERPEQMVRLRAIGVTLGQGFLFAQPMASDVLEEYLHRQSSMAS